MVLIKCWTNRCQIIYWPKDSVHTDSPLQDRDAEAQDGFLTSQVKHLGAEKPGLGLGFLSALGIALVAGLSHRANWPHIHTARFPSSLTFCGTNKKTAENKTCFPFARPFLGGCTLHTKMFAQTTLKHRERHEAETYTQTAWCGLVYVLILLVLIKKNKGINYLPEITKCL